MVHVPLMFLSEWLEVPSAPCLAGGKKVMTARVSVLLKSPRASPDMLPFSLCNKKRLAIRHMNRPLFPTILSIPSYDIGKYVGLRTYQHPFVFSPKLPFPPVQPFHQSFTLIFILVFLFSDGQ